MEKKTSLIISLALGIILSFSLVSAIYVEDDNTVFNMDHAIRVKSIDTNPEFIAPGSQGILTIVLRNNAKRYLDDLIVEINLPDEIKPVNDVNTFKISRLESLDTINASFKIVVSPTASEGIYDTNLVMTYVSYLGANYDNVGEEKEDNVTFGLVVKGTPSLFSQVEDSGVYKGNELGDITVKITNKGTGNAKFLVANLLPSEDYEIISSDKAYIGDLDSDDFDSADFRIKSKNKDKITLLLRADYKDILNQEYSEEFNLPLELRDAKDLGIATNGTSKIVAVIIILAIIGYVVYRKFRKKKKIITI